MKKSLYKLTFLVFFTLIFSGKLTAGSLTFMHGDSEGMRSLNFLLEYPCKSSRINYPLENMINETCKQDSFIQLNSKVGDDPEDSHHNDNFI